MTKLRTLNSVWNMLGLKPSNKHEEIHSAFVHSTSSESSSS